MFISGSSIFQSIVYVIHVKEDKTPGEQSFRVCIYWTVECQVFTESFMQGRVDFP